MSGSNSSQFWARVKLFIEMAVGDEIEAERLLSLIEKVGKCESIKEEPRSIRFLCNQLPLLDTFSEDWQKLLSYLEHQSKSGVNPTHTLNQLSLASQGVRGPALDQACEMLPL